MPLPNDIVQATNYDELSQTNEYTLRPGTCILPYAEDPPAATDPALATYSPVAVLRLHAPYRVRRHTFAADKQRNPPVMPTPQSAGKFEFLGGTISFATSDNASWFDSNWSCVAEYMYVETCVSRPIDGFVLGSAAPFTLNSDYEAIAAYGVTPLIPPFQQLPVGAIGGAGPNAVSGYNYAATLISPGNGVLELPINWSYTSAAFFPGQLFNDQLSNGGGTDGGQVLVSAELSTGEDGT